MWMVCRTTGVTSRQKPDIFERGRESGTFSGGSSRVLGYPGLVSVEPMPIRGKLNEIGTESPGLIEGARIDRHDFRRMSGCSEQQAAAMCAKTPGCRHPAAAGFRVNPGIASERKRRSAHDDDRQTCRARSTLAIPAMTDKLSQRRAVSLVLHRAAETTPFPGVRHRASPIFRRSMIPTLGWIVNDAGADVECHFVAGYWLMQLAC